MEPTPSHPTPYDSHAKELLYQAVPALLSLLGHVGASGKWVMQPNEEPVSSHRRADFVVKNLNTGEYIQVEFQTHADQRILRRCFLYAAPYFFKHGVLPLQYVLHLGNGPANYPREYANAHYQIKIEIIDLKTVPAEKLLREQYPEMVVMAILCAGESPDQLVEAVFERLQALVLDKERLGDYISIADTLSRLRNMKGLVKKKSKRMALDLDFTKSFIYEEAHEKGIEKGIEKGKINTLVEIVHSMHEDGLSLEKIARITHQSVEQVQAILDGPKPTTPAASA